MQIDDRLWTDMRQTFMGISMPLSSHQQIQNMLNHVEQQSTPVQQRQEPPAPPTIRKPIRAKANGAKPPEGPPQDPPTE